MLHDSTVRNPLGSSMGMFELSTILGNKALSGLFWTHSKTLVEGCSKISEGCSNCWAEGLARRFGGVVNECGNFDGTIRLHPERMADILPETNRRKPRIWTYWNDLFHCNVDDNFRDKLFAIIANSSDFHIICTKRPEEAARYLQERPQSNNCIILITMENQKRADERLLWAARISSAGWKTGALCEPMLSPIDLTGEWGACLHGNGPIRKQWIDALSWIICGPENGPGKRVFQEQWASDLQNQAKQRLVPFFYKGGVLDGTRYIETP